MQRMTRRQSIQLMLGIPPVVGVGAVLWGGHLSSPWGARAAVVRVRLVPHRSSEGSMTLEVLTDWTNTGSVPISAVHANISLYDAGERRLPSSVEDHLLFPATSEAGRVQPGQSHVTGPGEGFVVRAGDGWPARAEVQITRAM